MSIQEIHIIMEKIRYLGKVRVFNRSYDPISRFDTNSCQIYKTDYLRAVKHICRVNLHIWTGFGARYMPSANTCGQKAVQAEK